MLGQKSEDATRTLARYAAEGHEVTMCHASLGDRGSFVHPSAEITKIRLVSRARDSFQ